MFKNCIITHLICMCKFKQGENMRHKSHSYGEICIREYIFADMQIYSCVQICPCGRMYSRMQNVLHMLRTWLRSRANFSLHYANLTNMQVLSCERKVKFAYISKFISYVI